jgi:hypothetical protein
MNRRNFLQGIISFGISAVAAACVYDAQQGGGRPPQATAHRRRFRHSQGVDLDYDEGCVSDLVEILQRRPPGIWIWA